MSGLDADSSLAAIALGLSLALWAVLSAGEGYLLSGLRESPGEGREASHRKALPFLRDSGVRSLVRVGLTTSTVASGVALLMALTPRVGLVALGTGGILLSLVVIQGLSVGAGSRWAARARLLLPLLWPLALLAAPLSWLQSSVAAAFSRGSFGASGAPEYPIAPSSDPLRDFSDAQEEEGIAPRERRMITSILEMDETTAREIMVPRMDIVAAEATTSPNKVAELMWDSGHSRIPIYEESVDSIVGVVHSRDLLHHLAIGDTKVNLASIARPPLFVPDSKRLDDLLRNFQEEHIQIAIVVDEYGGVAGLVTIEDLLEEIVGEIEDEFNVEESLSVMVSDNEAVMDARISLEEVNQVFAVNLQGEGFDTLGGLLYQHFGRIPSPGDEVEVDGLRVRVLSTLGPRIRKVQVARATASESR